MDFRNYQTLSKRTFNKELDQVHAVINASMGMSGETGEVVDLLKKTIFHGHELDVQKLGEEIGDVLFYIAWLCEATGLDMDKVAEYNVMKLMERYPEGFSPEASKARVDVKPEEVVPEAPVEEKKPVGRPKKKKEVVAPEAVWEDKPQTPEGQE